MNTFPCDYGFAVLWTVCCFLGGGLCLLWVLSLCRSSGRADECAECLRRREHDDERAASAVIQGLKPLPILSDCCGVPIKECWGQLLCPHCLKPASQTITPPESGTSRGGNEKPDRVGTHYPRTIASGPLAGAILDYPAQPCVSPDAHGVKLPRRMA